MFEGKTNVNGHCVAFGAVCLVADYNISFNLGYL